MTKDEALRLALEALEVEYRMYEATDPETGAPYNMIEAITAIKAALEANEGDMGKVDKLRVALMKANNQAEHFEREWYLRGDEIERLKAALQAKDEPVAYGMRDTMIGKGNRMMYVRLGKGQDGCTVPLYTTPPQRTWVGLTNDELTDLFYNKNLGQESAVGQAIALLKERNK
jgi:hypothetical protein